MKLLIVTQKIDQDDPILGFFCRWVTEFAKHCETVSVICLEKGQYNLPENVEVFSLGKEKKQNRLIYIFNFYKYIFTLRKKYDSVFIHMNPIYIILGGWFWKISGIKTTLWYTHKSVDRKLKYAEKIVNNILTASQESFRLPSDKVRVVGHGIDTDFFSPSHIKEGGPTRIVTWGRVSPTKNIHILVGALEFLKAEHSDWDLVIIGPVEKENAAYLKSIKDGLKYKGITDRVIFTGGKKPLEIRNLISSNDVFINLSNTGSLDKSILEAMSFGLRVLTSNEAFVSILPTESLTTNNSQEIAQKLDLLSKNQPNKQLRMYIKEHHDLSQLILKIIKILSE